ncbi:MAG: ABC transporter permease [Oscillospiraceae bacterium]|nr:ABC transporter permease [Oscillospiraceae bacterium]
MKSIVFADRVGKEIRRDPLSYIFCIGFPIIMLIIMSIVDSSIPAQANMTIFHIHNLAPGIAYFGLTFVMLFTGIQVSKDRTTALLFRLYASPMKAADYVIGYTLPVCILGIVQMVICFTAAFLIGLCKGYTFSLSSILLSMLLLIPSLFMFAGIGILFGSAVSEKAAPGLCSIIISAVGIIGGIWMDINGIGGILKKAAEIMPFYHGVTLARLPFGNDLKQISAHLIQTVGFGIVFYVLAIVVFTSKMKKDVK